MTRAKRRAAPMIGADAAGHDRPPLRIHRPPEDDLGQVDVISPPIPPPDAFRAQALDRHKRLEIQECGCKLRLRQVCEDGPDGGCTERQETGRCECPCWYGPPCEHVLALASPISLTEWSDLLLFLWPGPDGPPPPRDEEAAKGWRARRDQGYADMPPCEPEREALSHEAILATLEARAEAGLSLRHPDDIWRNNPLRAGPTVIRLRNGGETQGETTAERRVAA